ncbi:hypothetical protein [Streptomyces sp. NPDC088726]|uniref:hypothetical protein n=1 Tax=Streptomyces sp. NPDC088726 TaxID=3365874 RepID=UPI0037F157F3
MNTALAKGDKVLILDAVDERSIQSSVQKARAAGVKAVAYGSLAAEMTVALAQGEDVPKSLTPTTVTSSSSGEEVPAGPLTPVTGPPALQGLSPPPTGSRPWSRSP